MHPAEGGHQVLQETALATEHQRLDTPDRQVLPRIQDTKEWSKQRKSDPVADRETPLPGTSLGQYHHKTGIIPRNIR